MVFVGIMAEAAGIPLVAGGTLQLDITLVMLTPKRGTQVVRRRRRLRRSGAPGTLGLADWRIGRGDIALGQEELIRSRRVAKLAVPELERIQRPRRRRMLPGMAADWLGAVEDRLAARRCLRRTIPLQQRLVHEPGFLGGWYGSGIDGMNPTPQLAHAIVFGDTPILLRRQGKAEMVSRNIIDCHRAGQELLDPRLFRRGAEGSRAGWRLGRCSDELRSRLLVVARLAYGIWRRRCACMVLIADQRRTGYLGESACLAQNWVDEELGHEGGHWVATDGGQRGAAPMTVKRRKRPMAMVGYRCPTQNGAKGFRRVLDIRNYTPCRHKRGPEQRSSQTGSRDDIRQPERGQLLSQGGPQGLFSG